MGLDWIAQKNKRLPRKQGKTDRGSINMPLDFRGKDVTLAVIADEDLRCEAFCNHNAKQCLSWQLPEDISVEEIHEAVRELLLAMIRSIEANKY